MGTAEHFELNDLGTMIAIQTMWCYRKFLWKIAIISRTVFCSARFKDTVSLADIDGGAAGGRTRGTAYPITFKRKKRIF